MIADDYWKPDQRMDETFKKDAEEIDRFFREHVSVSTIGELKMKYVGEFVQFLGESLPRSLYEAVKSFYESGEGKRLLTWGKDLKGR